MPCPRPRLCSLFLVSLAASLPQPATHLLPCAREAQGGGRAPGRPHHLPAGPALTSCPTTLRSYLAIPASSWVDDFIDWLTPPSCCRIYAFGPNKDEFCPSTVSE